MLSKNNVKSNKSHNTHVEEQRENTVFLTGLCGLIKKEELKAYLQSQAKGILSIMLPNKRNAGYSFVELDTKENVNQLIKLHDLKFNGRSIQIRPYVQGEDLQKFKNEVNSRRLFVSKIPKTWADEALKEMFLPFGELENAYIIRKRKTKKSKGFGYVIYKNKEKAQQVASLNQILYKGSEILVKMHEPKQRRFGKKASKAFTKEQADGILYVKKKTTEENKEEEVIKKEPEKIKIPYESTFHWISPNKTEYFLREMNYESYSRPEEYELSFEPRSRAFKRRNLFNQVLRINYQPLRRRFLARKNYLEKESYQACTTSPLYF